MLTVKLTKTRLTDPQDMGSSPVVDPACLWSVSPILLNLTIPMRYIGYSKDGAFEPFTDRDVAVNLQP